MMTTFKYTLMLLLLGLFFCLPSAHGQNPKVLEQLTRRPLITAPTLSSGGHFIAAIVRDEETADVAVWMVKFGFLARETLPYKRKDLNWMSWIGGGRLLLSLNEKGLVLYDAHIKRLRPLIDTGGPRPDELPPILLSHLPDDPTSILLQWEDPQASGYPAVYKVDAVQGVSEKIISAWQPVIRWWASPQGEVLLGEGFDGGDQLLFNRNRSGGWKLLSQKDYFNGSPPLMLSVETGGATALVLSTKGSDTRSLWRMNIENGQLLSKLGGHKDYDMSAALLDPVLQQAVGVAYTAEKAEEHLWEDNNKAERAKVAALTGVDDIYLMSSSLDRSLSLYRDRHTSRRSRYYLYRANSEKIETLPYDKDTPAESYVSKSVYIDVEGTNRAMHAVLSEPLERKASASKAGASKAVVLIHGGPVRRIQQTYSPLIAWLTFHGYVVLQPNFRGSNGFGEKWRTAGYGEWGGVMQDDITAAGNWLVSEGYSHHRDMCAVGGSYGGYASLMAVIKDYDLFACAVSLNGVTSVLSYVKQLEKLRYPMLSVPRVKAKLSAKALKKRSPSYLAKYVGSPVLLVHGTNDGTVPYKHSVRMARALQKANKEYYFVSINGAGHKLFKPSERRTYYTHLLTFLESQIGE